MFYNSFFLTYRSQIGGLEITLRFIPVGNDNTSEVTVSSVSCNHDNYTLVFSQNYWFLFVIRGLVTLGMRIPLEESILEDEEKGWCQREAASGFVRVDFGVKRG